MAKTKTGKGKKKSAALRMIGVSDFRNLVKQCNNLKKKAGSANSEMGGLVSNAAENKYLDKVAFSIFRRLERMEPQKLGTTLAHLDYYRDIGRLDEKVEDAPEMEMGERTEIKEGGKVIEMRAAE